MVYHYPSILLNQQEVSLNSILHQEINTENNFEKSALTFIRDWLSEKASFTLQTSGSTGTPKLFTFTRQQMQQSATRTIKALGLGAGDEALVCLNIQYIAGKMMLVRALEHQLKLSVVDPSSNPFEKLPPHYQPDFMAVVPLQLQTLISDPKNHSRLNNMKAILVGGAPVSASIRHHIQSLKCPIYETYGMTETLSNVALRLLNTAHKTDRFVPLAGVTLSLGERGCLIIHDTNQSEPLVTNDLGEIDAQGHFTWLGRFDNVINTGGIKVYPEKIEQNLEEQLQEIRPALSYFIGPTPDDRFGQVVTLFLSKSELSQTDLDNIITKIRTLPSDPEKPQKIALISTWKLTETGKTDRKRIISSLSDPKKQIIEIL